MSTGAKAKPKPCRIPTFGSKIPQIAPKPSSTDSKSPSPTSELNESHLGRTVRIAEKEGLLKYIGSVHFAKGIWCGIELFTASGKNNGTVNGVQYFTCSPLRGLMAPVAKVTLIEGFSKSVEGDNISGPYSILYLDSPKLPENQFPVSHNITLTDNKTSDCTYEVEKENQKHNLTIRTDGKASITTRSNDNLCHVELEQTFINSVTNDLRKHVSTERGLLKHCYGSSVDNLSEADVRQKNDTFELILHKTYSTETLNKDQNLTYDLKKSEYINGSIEVFEQLPLNETLTFNAKQVSTSPNSPAENGNDKRIIPAKRRTFDIEPNTKKRTNDTFNRSLIQNSEQEHLSHLSINKSCEALLNDSTVEVKRRRTSRSDNTFEKNHTPDKCNSSFQSTNPSHSTPLQALFRNDFKNIRISNINLCYDQDKTCLTENDCSLSLLTTGQIEEFSEIGAEVQKLFNETDNKRHNTFSSKIDVTSYRRPPLEKPSSLPQLLLAKQIHSFSSPSTSFSNLNQLDYSQPVRNDILDNLRTFQSANIPDNEGDGSKRDSLDCDESLDILTPDQMVDFTVSFECDKPNSILTPDRAVHFQSSQNQPVIIEQNSITNDVGTKEVTSTQSFSKYNGFGNDTTNIREDVQSPNLNSITEYSFGIIDPDQMLSAFTILKTDTTMNLDLPLDSVADSKNFVPVRCEETPSPEELPLDTTPIVESEPSKTEPTKSKTNSSFITSITSITSLDTGYQGDGEMSRPASRGADNSPLTRRPFPRALPRRTDPMTDSDFYTESDADNHEDNQVKGDRRAQVIDGTLYGVDPQAAADIYVNNRENMDSSGVFTDIESGLRNDDEVYNENESGTEQNKNKANDVSPSESTKTISVNSQSNIQEFLLKSNETHDKSLDKTVKENPKKRNAPSPGISSTSSLSSPRHINKEENAAKKYKMPKREVTSKVKTMLGEPATISPEKKAFKKPVNRWDAVMNKISKNEQNKTNLKEVKSKVFNNVNLSNGSNSVRSVEVRKPASPIASQNNKSRRIRTRTPHTLSPLKKNMGNNLESSIHSSLSDLSASAPDPKKTPGSTKKRDTIQVTQVLTPNKLTTRNQQNLTETKKNAINTINSTPSPQSDNKPERVKRTIFPVKEKKLQIVPKESSKPTVKGGRISPSVRAPAQLTTRAPVKKVSPASRAAEALAVLVQHLVFNVEAYQVPHLKRQVEKLRLEAEEIRLAYQHLEEVSADEKLKHVTNIADERLRFRDEITALIENHRKEVNHLTSQHAETEQRLRLEKEVSDQTLSQKHDEQLTLLRRELERLQKSHEEALDILREENDCIREQIDETRLELERANHESAKLKKDYETTEIKLKEEVESIKAQRDNLKYQIGKLESDFQGKINELVEENRRLRDQNDRLLSYGDDKDIAKQEVQSLRVVLELKQNEIAELRKSLEESKQKQQILEGAEEKASTLQARCEDLQHQLQRKCEYEHTLIQENQKLQESFKEEINHSRRLSQHNEELQWKLRQNKEVFDKVIEQAAEDTVFNRSTIYSSSFSEKHTSSKSLERTSSFKEASQRSGINIDTPNRSRISKNSSVFDDDLSPPSSPKVKGVVEKSDSVSYVLDLDESPELVASRILRRSFRNTTPPKNTPTKSPSNKRPRMRNPLTMSASSSALLSTSKEESDRPKSASGRNGNMEDDDVFLWDHPQSTPKYRGKLSSSCDSAHSRMKLDENIDLDEDNEVDIQLPALPNEMDKRNGVLTLPVPSRLADGAGSESNSEDESTSSSQL